MDTLSFRKLKGKSKFHSKAEGCFSYTINKQREEKLYTRTVNHQKDYLQELSTKLGEGSDVIVVEKIDLRVMGFTLQFGKISTKTDLGCSGRDSLISSSGEFPFCSSQIYASSQVCHCCGKRNPKVRNMEVRFWKCSVCGHSFARNHNAAISIREEGQYVNIKPG